MLWGATGGGLEVRRKGGALRLAGSFPYNKAAVLSDGGRTGRPRKERIRSRAFGHRVEDSTAQIHLLIGHDYNRPLASRKAGTLALEDGDEALRFEADIPDEIAGTSYGRDALAQLGAGLVGGISPGFKLPPRRAVAKAEVIEEEPDRPEEGMHRAIIRTVTDALLYELSLVTQPAYPETQIEARDWSLAGAALPRARTALVGRWRA